MYDIRCRDVMEPNSVGRLSGGSVTKNSARAKTGKQPKID